jgi:predicted Kef-type K+ transport protein
LKVGLAATSSMHETKGSISTYQLILEAALFQFNATTQSTKKMNLAGTSFSIALNPLLSNILEYY